MIKKKQWTSFKSFKTGLVYTKGFKACVVLEKTRCNVKNPWWQQIMLLHCFGFPSFLSKLTEFKGTKGASMPGTISTVQCNTLLVSVKQFGVNFGRIVFWYAASRFFIVEPLYCIWTGGHMLWNTVFRHALVSWPGVQFGYTFYITWIAAASDMMVHSVL